MKTTKDMLAIANRLWVDVDEQPKPNNDEDRMHAFERWAPVVGNAGIVPCKAINDRPLRKAQFQAPLALAALLLPEEARQFVEQLTGQRTVGDAAKSFLRVLGEWKSGKQVGPFVLSCVEVGCGLARSKPRSDTDAAIRWRDRYDEWMLRRPTRR
jgi:hypothetical protein